MPTYHPTDHHAIHPRPHDSFLTRLFATKDALYDPHNLFIQAIKTGFAWAGVSIIIGMAIKNSFGKDLSRLAKEKIYKNTRKSNFGVT